MTRSSAFLLLSLAAGGSLRAAAQSDGYLPHRALAAALDSLRRAHPQLVELTPIAQSPGGRVVHAVRLGAGANAGERPALLVVANASGPDLVGSAVALDLLRRLAAGYGQDTAVTRLLDRVTLYVIPRANPDAAEAFFAAPLVERVRNGEATDDDRDGAADEDGPEDVNGDGLITLMRVSDPAGDWVADSAEPALLRKADRAKGERGTFRVYPEGRDNDGDERWNEDPPGGVEVNRNFSYGYEFFGEAAGVHPISAPETRAIAQFFVDHPNIAAVYALGPQDNLLKAWEFRRSTGQGGATPGTSQGGPLLSIMESDGAWFAEVARRFRKLTALEKGPASADGKGDVLSFSYYEMGRWAFGSRAWWIPDLPAAPPDTTAGARPGGAGPTGGATARGGGTDAKDPLEEERNQLRWIRANRPDGFVEWRAVSHPDFPGRTVEVGGFRPYVRTNPPAAQLDSVFAKQARFVTALAELLPSVAIRDVRVERVGDRLFRVTARVANDGYFPTLAAVGERVRWPRRVRVELKTTGQEISGGRAVQLLDAIRGSGASVELTWLLVGASGSQVTLSASSPVAGQAVTTITLH